DAVLLDLSPAAAPEPEPAAGQVLVEVGGRERKTSGHAFDDADERLAVRFAGGQITDHTLERWNVSALGRGGPKIAHDSPQIVLTFNLQPFNGLLLQSRRRRLRRRTAGCASGPALQHGEAPPPPRPP